MKNETNIADIMPEPDNGTRLVRIEYDGKPTVIWRDDAVATRQHPDERWVYDLDTDPMDWREILRYATQVYSISEMPLAELPPANVVRGARGEESRRRPNQITVTQAIDTVAPGSSVTGLRIDNL